MKALWAIAAVAAAGMALAGCRQEPVAEAPTPLAEPCDAAKVQDLIGQARSDALAEDARKRSGAKVARYLTPDMMITMEYRADRLNLVLGTDGRVGSIRCG